MNKQAHKSDNMLIFKSDFAELSRIRNFILKEAASFGFSEETAQKISLAVDEACSNLIKHAYKFDADKLIKINVEKKNNSFIVNIEDDGSPFNPIQVPKRDMKEYMQNYEKGGLGIHIIKSVMDEIKYVPSGKKHPYNLLTLKKALG